MSIIIGLGEYAVSQQSGIEIKTFALGSCVAVVTYDPIQKIAGMLHVVLPKSSIAPQKLPQYPGYFADTGVNALVDAMMYAGSSGQFLIKLTGGAQIADPNFHFNVGKRNILAVRKNLWRLRKVPIAEDVGGNISRTVSISVDTGIIEISTPGQKNWRL